MTAAAHQRLRARLPMAAPKSSILVLRITWEALVMASSPVIHWDTPGDRRPKRNTAAEAAAKLPPTSSLVRIALNRVSDSAADQIIVDFGTIGRAARPFAL